MRLITDANKIDKDKWLDFVHRHPQGNVFQTPQMYYAFSRSKKNKPFSVFLVNEESENIIGILIGIFITESSWPIRYISSRAIIWGGPLVLESSLLSVLLSGLTKVIPPTAIYIQFRNIFSLENEIESFQQHSFKFEDHLDVWIDLQKPIDQIWEKVHKNRKKEIKNGYKKGLIVLVNDTPDDKTINIIYDLLKINYRRLRLPLLAHYDFKVIVLSLIKDGLLKLFLAKIGDKIVAFRLDLVFKNMIYDWYAASDFDYLSYRPNDVLPWEVVMWGHNHIYKSFCFGGAGKTGKPYGVRDYKLKFGGEITSYGRYTCIKKPIMYYSITSLINIYQKITKSFRA